MKARTRNDIVRDAMPLGLGLLLALSTGCVRRVEPAPDNTAAKPHEPGISVTTYGKGPMKYQVLTTNQPDGAKSYRFVPAQ